MECLSRIDFDIIFFDEIDGIALDRGLSGENFEIKRANLEVMKFLDNLDDGKYLFAATNIVNMIDKATVRRFEKVINFDLLGKETNKMFDVIKEKFVEQYNDQRVMREYSALLRAVSQNIQAKKPSEIKKFFTHFDFYFRNDRKNIKKLVKEFLELDSSNILKDLQEMRFSNTSINLLGVKKDD